MRFGRGDSLDAVAVGLCDIPLPRGRFWLYKCYFVHGCVANIISLFILDTERYYINIKKCSLYLYSSNNIQILVCPNQHGHYVLQTFRDILNTGINKRKWSEINYTELWHMRLGQ